MSNRVQIPCAIVELFDFWHLAVWKIMFLSRWVICRFQPLIFQGVLLVALPPIFPPKHMATHHASRSFWWRPPRLRIWSSTALLWVSSCKSMLDHYCQDVDVGKVAKKSIDTSILLILFVERLVQVCRDWTTWPNFGKSRIFKKPYHPITLLRVIPTMRCWVEVVRWGLSLRIWWEEWRIWEHWFQVSLA